jgi:hypothetical protein
LARLTSDPHVNWDSATQKSAVDQCVHVVAEYHEKKIGAILSDTTLSVLRPLFTGEPASVRIMKLHGSRRVCRDYKFHSSTS